MYVFSSQVISVQLNKAFYKTHFFHINWPYVDVIITIGVVLFFQDKCLHSASLQKNIQMIA